MLVCAHGNVVDFCKERGMSIADTWNGEILKYSGVCRVIVTDADISESEYYFYKGEMLARGYELVSTRYIDDAVMMGYLTYANQRRKEKYSGRQSFSDEIVIKKILELREAGMTLRAIRDAEGVCHPDGRKLSLSTIQSIVKKEEGKKVIWI